MKIIELTQGKTAIVDDDFPVLYKYRAALDKKHRTGYAVRYGINSRDGREQAVMLHRDVVAWHRGCDILDLPKIDHINKDGFDCRIQNLRDANHSQNKANGAKYRTSHGIPTSSKFKGVTRKGKWYAQIRFNGKIVSLGYFHIEEEAAKAYDVAARRLFGPFAHCNFPQGPLHSIPPPPSDPKLM